MRRIAAYVFHLAVASLTVPIFSLNLGVLLYSFLLRQDTSTPQQFYSDHLLSVTACTGLLLAYIVCGIFANTEARWIWVPSTALFLFRLLIWRAGGTVNTGVGAFEHFFAVNCQFEAWRQPEFAVRCSDKLFLSTQFIGGLAYSVGAAIRVFVRRKREAAAYPAPTEPEETVTLGRALLLGNLALPTLGVYLYFKGTALYTLLYSLGVTCLVVNVYLLLAFKWWGTEPTDDSSPH